MAPFPGAAYDLFRRQAAEFVARELTPRVERWERAGRFPHQALRSCARAGLLDLDPYQSAVFAEEVSRCGSLGIALNVFVQSGLIRPLLERLGTAAQKERFLKPLVAGRLVGAMAVTEPAAGSDFSRLQCAATPTRAGYELNGEKTYITNAAVADVLVVAARAAAAGAEAASAGAGGELSLILVPTTTRGVHVTPLAPLGLTTTAMARVTLSSCRVGHEHVLGEPGAAYRYIQDALNRERLYCGLGAVAWALEALEKTRGFLRGRRAFGRSLNRFQAVRHQMADVATNLEAARQLNYATFMRWADGDDVTKEIAMVKLFGYREAQRAIEVCLQMHGGAGYMADHWASRRYRDARALTIAAGTPEVMRELVAACLRL
jgi:acyl-CoA dehydrogenase